MWKLTIEDDEGTKTLLPLVRDGFRFRLLPAGHITGSAMLHVTRLKDNATLLYTGDFKTRRGRTAERGALAMHIGSAAAENRCFFVRRLMVPGCYRGDPAVANRGFGLGRACTLKSWLSMWSLETSKCQGPEQLAKFAIPALVIQSRADKGVFLSDAKKMFEAVGSKDKTQELIPGNHYLEDGPDYRHRAAGIIADWVKARA